MSKLNKTQWIIDKLSTKTSEEVLNLFDQFKKQFPTATKTSFATTVRREAKNIKDLGSEKVRAEAEQKIREREQRDKIKIAKTYALQAKKSNSLPSRDKLKDLGVDINILRSLFNSMNDLEQFAREQFPKHFAKVVDYRIFNTGRSKELQSLVSKNNKFVVTTIVGGCPIDKDFLDSLRGYCTINNAMLLFLVADNDLAALPDELEDDNIVYVDTKINDHLYLSAIKILPKMINPTTGLNRIGGKNGSFIFGSPKQSLEYVPVKDSNMIPHAIMTTGAVTLPRYQGRRYYQKRTDYLANQDHKMGAIVVEKESNKVFHFRQIQADNNGNFIDLGKKYSSDGTVSDAKVEALVYGDWHSGDTDPMVARCWREIANQIKPKAVVIHDGFNGHSINHHEFNMPINRAATAEADRDNLKEELDVYAQDLNEIAKSYESVYIVWSNHDEFVRKYLNNGMYVSDPRNHLLAIYSKRPRINIVFSTNIQV